jgi:hypothetical protein
VLVIVSGQTNLFSHPRHIFRGFDALITKLPLPRGDRLELLQEAIRHRCRFHSYGAAELILSQNSIKMWPGLLTRRSVIYRNTHFPRGSFINIRTDVLVP